MSIVRHNPSAMYPPYHSYSHATEVRGDSRLLVIAGLNGYEADGVTMPESFDEQAELIWSHLRTALAAAEMDFSNLISLRFYLAEPEYDEANVRILRRHLGELQVPRTVLCARLLEPGWKLEVEAMAAT
ncbi:RidA family protein [Agromyces albus]|uniref:RidA family protein n=1 Tax=Agromyces albus TaxID=205332 RepID=A0A4Q2L980_9MICO|nr:RidA family protein [Agromyces albus]RXZ73193.1 RidA family protein [Agromyces albus]